MFCIHCGKENDNDSRYCMNCGFDMQENTEGPDAGFQNEKGEVAKTAKDTFGTLARNFKTMSEEKIRLVTEKGNVIKDRLVSGRELNATELSRLECQVREDLRKEFIMVQDEGYSRGLLEGERKGKIYAYLDMNVSIEDVAEKLNLTTSEVENIIASLDKQ